MLFSLGCGALVTSWVRGWGLGNDEKDLRHEYMGMVLGNTWLEVRVDLGVRLEG